MTRFSIAVVMIVAAALLAAPAWAAVPYPPNCTVAWTTAPVDSAVILCPQGDGNSLTVTVRDQFNTVMPGVTVTAAFTDARVMMVASITGVTNVGGVVVLTIKAGANSSASTIAFSSLVTVTCETVPIWTDTKLIYSPDVSGDKIVNATDYVYFNGQWGQTQKDNRANYLHSNALVNAADYVIFNGHWKHQ